MQVSGDVAHESAGLAPLHRRATSATQPRGEPRRGMAQVLVVDDSAHARLLVRQTLVAAGHEVLEAADARWAWQLLLTHRPDVAIVDVTMPALSGLDLCRAIRADPEFQNLPIVILTARALSEDREAALAAGADRFLPKPFRPSDLLEALAGLCDEGPAVVKRAEATSRAAEAKPSAYNTAPTA